MFVAGAVAVSTGGAICADAMPSGSLAVEATDVATTLSMAPQHPVIVEVGAQTIERLWVLVLGVSPTLLEPATVPGIDSLGAGRLPPTSSRKTAWMDYMLSPMAPAWSLRLATKSGFEMTGSERPSLATSPLGLEAEAAASGRGFGKFGLSGAAPASPSTSLTPGAWSAFGDAGVRSALMPTPITSLRGSAAEFSDAGLLPTSLSTPTSTAGAAAGAAQLLSPAGR
jgi:hypothetical protein